MSHKLDSYRQQILDLREAGESVRKIAETIGQPASTIHHAIKHWSNGNGESKPSGEVDQAVLLGKLDSIEVRLQQLQKQVEQIDERPYPLWAYVVGGIWWIYKSIRRLYDRARASRMA